MSSVFRCDPCPVHHGEITGTNTVSMASSSNIQDIHARGQMIQVCSYLSACPATTPFPASPIVMGQRVSSIPVDSLLSSNSPSYSFFRQHFILSTTLILPWRRKNRSVWSHPVHCAHQWHPSAPKCQRLSRRKSSSNKSRDVYHLDVLYRNDEDDSCWRLNNEICFHAK